MAALTRRAFLIVGGLVAAGATLLGRQPTDAAAGGCRPRPPRVGVYSNTYSNTY